MLSSLRRVTLAALLLSAIPVVIPADDGAVPDEWVRTQHTLTTPSGTYRYTATAGMMPIREDVQDEVQAHVFFMAYTLDDAPEGRPLTFSFNGGPGSSSVWLHLGALGPRRVPLMPDGSLPPPPYEVVNNPESWLPFTDLVFIDPVGTGFSRPVSPNLGSQFWGATGDIASFRDFIRNYLNREARWNAPLFLVGESYGTFRAAGLSRALWRDGISVSGIMLVSTVLDFGSLRAANNNLLPYALYFPTLAATAHYHRRLSPEMQRRSLRDFLDEVEDFVLDVYLPALMRGNSLTEAQWDDIGELMSRYLGISPQFIKNANYTVSDGLFYKELMRDERTTVGRFDSRLTGIPPDAASGTTGYDPSYVNLYAPYTMAFNQYVREELGFKTDRKYFILGGGVRSPWSYPENRYAETVEDLRAVLTENPYMRVLVMSGYYDVATPYFAAEHSFRTMNLDPRRSDQVEFTYYEAGHMMYIEENELRKFTRDVRDFVRRSVNQNPRR